MVNKTFHILNGDALKEQFPSDILGEKVVARLCLVDGPVAAETDEELFKIRAAFISESFPEYAPEDYLNMVVLEIQGLKNIPEHSTINLWFEDDLFCQVNLWFMLYFISKNNKNFKLNLVRPHKHSEYAFGGMSEEALVKAYHDKLSITSEDLEILQAFWNLYQKNKLSELLNLAQKVKNKFPFLIPAISAQQDRLSDPSRPKAAIYQIMKTLKTDKFPPVFKAFCQQESIYGFGDFQVKRIFDEVISEKKIG